MSSFWRSLDTVREWRKGRYNRIIVTGKDIAPLMKDLLMGQGITRHRNEVERQATFTHEKALELLNS